MTTKITKNVHMIVERCHGMHLNSDSKMININYNNGILHSRRDSEGGREREREEKGGETVQISKQLWKELASLFLACAEACLV